MTNPTLALFLFLAVSSVTHANEFGGFQNYELWSSLGADGKLAYLMGVSDGMMAQGILKTYMDMMPKASYAEIITFITLLYESPENRKIAIPLGMLILHAQLQGKDEIFRQAMIQYFRKKDAFWVLMEMASAEEAATNKPRE